MPRQELRAHRDRFRFTRARALPYAVVRACTLLLPSSYESPRPRPRSPLATRRNVPPSFLASRCFSRVDNDLLTLANVRARTFRGNGERTDGKGIVLRERKFGKLDSRTFARARILLLILCCSARDDLV